MTRHHRLAASLAAYATAGNTSRSYSFVGKERATEAVALVPNASVIEKGVSVVIDTMYYGAQAGKMNA